MKSSSNEEKYGKLTIHRYGIVKGYFQLGKLSQGNKRISKDIKYLSNYNRTNFFFMSSFVLNLK